MRSTSVTNQLRSLASTLPLACAHPSIRYVQGTWWLLIPWLLIPSHQLLTQRRAQTIPKTNGTEHRREVKEAIFYLLARTTTFISEQNRTGTKAHVVLRRHTWGHTGSTKHGALLFWVVTRHWFVVGYRLFGMVSSAA